MDSRRRRWLFVCLCGIGLLSAHAFGADPILWAAHNGETDVVKALLAKGSDINARDDRGFTPLMHALKFGFPDTTKFLIGAGADVNATTKAGCSILMFATEAGDIDAVKAILARGADVNHQSDDGCCAFILAVQQGNPEIVKLLLDKGADPNATIQGMPVLHGALNRGQMDIVDLLIARGANINLPDADGGTLLEVAAQAGNIPMVKRLLAAGLDVNAYCDACGTALSCAARTGHLECMRALLAAGADPRADNDVAATVADRFGQVEALKMIQAAGGESQLQEQQSAAPAASPEPMDAATAALLAPIPATSAPKQPAVRKAGSLRLAILSDDPSTPEAAALTADLSDKFDLLERDEIASLVSEQELAQAGFVARESLAGLGKLLHAQAMVLFDTQQVGGREVERVRLVSAVTGVVLDSVYQKAPVSDPVAFAGKIAARIEALAPKLTIPADQTVAVSVLNLRLTTDVPGGGELETTLTRLLEHLLVHEPRVFLLDRSEMDRLTAETADNSFRGGDYLVDGDIEPDLTHAKEFTLKLRVRLGGREKAEEVSVAGDADHLLELGSRAIEKLRPLLKLSGKATAWDPAAEAQNYFEEAGWAEGCRLMDKAGSAAESAWALGLHTQAVAEIRVKSLLAPLRLLEKTLVDNVIACQYRPYTDSTPFDCPDRPPDLLSAAQCFARATRALDIYDDFSSHAAVDDQHAWSLAGIDLLQDATAPLISLTTASSEIQYEKEAKLLRGRLRAIADNMIGKANGWDLGMLAAMEAARARWWCDAPGQFVDLQMRLLACHFDRDNGYYQAKVRAGIVGSCNGWVAFGDDLDQRWFRPGRPEAFWKTLSAKLQNDPRLDNQMVRHGIDLCFDGPVGERLAAGAALKNTLWDMRHVLAQDTRELTVYLGMISQFQMNDWVANNFGLCRGWSEKAHPDVQRYPEYYQFLCDYIVSLAAESDDVDPVLLRGLAMTPFTDTQKKRVGDALTAFLSRRGAAKPLGMNTVEKVLRFYGFIASGDTYPEIKLGTFWSAAALLAPGAPGAAHFRLDNLSATSSEGKLWVCGASGENDQTFTYIFEVTPGTLETKLLCLPRRGMNSEEVSYAVTVSPHFIFLGQEGGYLAVYDRDRQSWTYYDQIKPDGQPMAYRGTTLYLTTKANDGSGIIAFNNSTHTSELIASTRRRPAQSPLDDPSYMILRIFAAEDGRIYPVTTLSNPDPTTSPTELPNELYNPASRSWTKIDFGAAMDFVWQCSPRILDPTGERWAISGPMVNPGMPQPAGSYKDQVGLRYLSHSKGAESRVLLDGKAPPNPWYPQNMDNLPATVFIGSDFLACFDMQATGCWFIPKEQLAPYMNGKGIPLAQIR